MVSFMEEQIYIYHAEMCKVFSHPKRLELINLLRDQEVSAGELRERLGLTPANLSQHLIILREKDVVDTRRDGTTIYYSLANPRIIKAFDIIRRMLLEKLTRTGKLARDMRRSQKR